MDKYPSLIHIFLTIMFGPLGGIVLRWHYNRQDDRQMGSFMWYVSWIAVLASSTSALAFILPTVGLGVAGNIPYD